MGTDLILSSKAHEQYQTGKKTESLLGKFLVYTVFIIAIIAMFYVNVLFRGKFSFSIGIYGMCMAAYQLLKMVLSFTYKPKTGDPPDLKVSVVIPSYNEKPEAVVNIVQSILRQDYPIHEIFFIDDGSKDTKGYEAVLKLQSELNVSNNTMASSIQTESSGLQMPKLIVHRLPQNQGKRHAQIWAFKRVTGDVILTTDSDGYIFHDAVRELLIPFHDPNVMAVTGHIRARNRNENWLTKLLDMRYANAFRVERAAQSVSGNVTVCSGPISCYRREVIIDNLDQYGNQTFLGENVQYGDDRCLTNYAILKGKTVYQANAMCMTDVPSTVRQFIKQQIRWNKSFFRESLLALKVGFKKPITLIWVLMELLLWILFSITFFISLFIKPLVMGWLTIVYYFAYLALSAYSRNVFYILRHPLTFVLAPLYGIIHITLLFPLRFYSLLTLKSTRWGTR